MEIIIFIFCCYLNYSRAKLAQLNGLKWALYTLVAVFVTLMVGSAILLYSLAAKDPTLKAMITDKQPDSEALLQYMQDKVTFLHHLIMFFSGIGGYLFVRYILNKKIEAQHNSPS